METDVKRANAPLVLLLAFASIRVIRGPSDSIGAQADRSTSVREKRHATGFDSHRGTNFPSSRP